jgi:uncharacterized membrane protein
MSWFNVPQQQRNISRVERVADTITVFCSNTWFIVLHCIWFCGWIVYNVLVENSFDPYPFGLLTLIVSLEAILLSSFILLSQRRESIFAERRAEYDLNVNVRTEQHAKETLRLLREIHEHQITGKKELPHDRR